MSQRAVLRGFFLCILAVLVAVPAGAQIDDRRHDHVLADPATLSVGETSPSLITAPIVYPGGSGRPTGPQTLDFNDLPYGVTTVPSTVTFTTAPGQTSATVTFRLCRRGRTRVSESSSMSVYSTPAVAYGTAGLLSRTASRSCPRR